MPETRHDVVKGRQRWPDLPEAFAHVLAERLNTRKRRGRARAKVVNAR